MRVVWLTAFGGPEVLVAGEAPDPEPGPGQALIDVAGFEVEGVYGGFERQPLDETATEFVWVVRRPVRA